MKLLNHLNPADSSLLSVINDNWPVQFLSEYSRFHVHFLNTPIKIVYDEESRAYLPLLFIDRVLFKQAQILYAPHRDAEELNKNEQLAYFNRLIVFLSQSGQCERLAQPHPFGILAAYPQGSKQCDFGTYIVDLENQDETQIFEKFHPKYQKAIVHSQKNGAAVKIGRESLSDFYKLYEATMKKAGMHRDSNEYFVSLYNYLGDNRVISAVVYDQGNPVSGIFVIYTKYSAFLTHAGTFGDSKLYGAAKLLNYEVMKYLKNRGVKKYDFVGVRIRNNNPELEGIFRFKKGFGGNLKTGYLWKTDILPFKAKAYDLLIQLKPGKTKMADIIDQVNQE
jgi:hypothetical protein